MDLQAAENAYKSENKIEIKKDWLCPCNGCQKAVKSERKEIIEVIKKHLLDYQIYRGSSFDNNGNIFWMKDDVQAYSEAIAEVIKIIEDRNPKPVKRQSV